MSDHSNTQSYADYHDNDQKCLSIGEYVDSGIGSMTQSDVETNQRILEKINETESDGITEFQNIVSGSNTEQKDAYDDDDAIVSESYQSMTPEDEACAPYIPNDSGYSELHYAVCDRNIGKAIDLIQQCPDSGYLNHFTRNLHTSLHLAVFSNSPEVVRFLIIYGVDLNFKDERGNTALHTACENGRLQCLRMLLSPLDEVENIGIQDLKIPQDINEKNYEGLTPLHLATINMHTDIVKCLLKQPKVNLNIGDSTAGRTALHHALERRHLPCFYELLKSSANINATTYDGCSPLHLAVGYELTKETKSLMSKGAKTHLITGENTKAYDLARTQELKDALHHSMIRLQNLTVKQR